MCGDCEQEVVCERAAEQQAGQTRLVLIGLCLLPRLCWLAGWVFRGGCWCCWCVAISWGSVRGWAGTVVFIHRAVSTSF